MAAVNGVLGSVVWSAGIFANLDTNVKSWSLDYTADMLDSTDFGSSGPRDFIGGLTTWSGTFECLLDSVTAAIADPTDLGGAAVTLTLTATTNRTYAGTAICSGIHPSVTVEGINVMTVDFQGSGALSIG